jgi:putative hydrolase of the HAD superfamily
VSEIAEFARKLHERESKIYERPINPVHIPAKSDKVRDIRAVICDVYGTMFNYWQPGFDQQGGKDTVLLRAFREVADRFGMTHYLVEMNPLDPPEKTLNDFYNGLIALSHEKEIKKGVAYPEIRIEDIWGLIILMLKRHGYNPREYNSGAEKEFGRYVAYSYNFLSLGRQMYPGVVDALENLHQSNIHLGILSNGQFYTPIDITLFIRDQSDGRFEDMNELFDPDLVFFSYQYMVAKPNPLLFQKLFDALYEYHILPNQTVFVGNDLALDIAPALEAGMRTALFTGDENATYVHELSGKVVPDICFDDWSELPQKISFFSEGNQTL